MLRLKTKMPESCAHLADLGRVNTTLSCTYVDTPVAQWKWINSHDWMLASSAKVYEQPVYPRALKWGHHVLLDWLCNATFSCTAGTHRYYLQWRQYGTSPIDKCFAHNTQPGKAGQLLNGACNLEPKKCRRQCVFSTPARCRLEWLCAAVYEGGQSGDPVHFKPHSSMRKKKKK